MKAKLEKAMEDNSAVKLEVNGHADPYFGTVLEVTGTSATLQHGDGPATTPLSEITDLYII